MNTNRLKTISSVERWNRFWFASRRPEQIGTVRVVVGIVVAIQFAIYLAIAKDWFGDTGILESSVGKYLIGDGIDGTGSQYRWTPLFAFSEYATAIALMGMVASLLMSAGIGSRFSPAIAWIALVSIHHRAPMIISLYEPLLCAAVTYLIIDPGRLVWKIQPGLSSGESRWSANFSLRLIQIHFALWIAFGLCSMLAYPAWWNGEAGWGLITQKRGLLRLGAGSEWIGQWMTHTIVVLQLGLLFCMANFHWRWLGRWILIALIASMLMLSSDWMYAAVLLAVSVAIWPVTLPFRKDTDEPHR